ncbi:hypothetical protein Lal_00003889 [Lupinus albus]|uniref:Uncharacterized protein n=1 Tax=Lupinus albus TaxID=3870 RepID=A0A6A4PE10_LUPAL|nr:hypothetical protein Lalb_Chr15g0076711 [Lupinus albus]KAF1893974.1 hypothetical protein Lal_00003889 [Lupinus albus]
MAINCVSSTQIQVHIYGSFLKNPSKNFMYKHSSISLKKSPIFKITASIKNKVYEDRSQGIVCYQDEYGEITCEGYDEGPCFQRSSKPTYQPSDAKIRNVLVGQSWVQIVKGEEVNDAVEGFCLKEELNCNGFNSFH